MLDFEHDHHLDDLLTASQLEDLNRLLSVLVGGNLSIRTSLPGDAPAIPIEFNLETVGWIHGSAPQEKKTAAAELMAFLTYFIAKYQLAANLHRSTTESSYQELQLRNEELLRSQDQLRTLADSLQQRVEAQVQTVKTAQKELYESTRLRSVGQLAAGIAHEINNPIGFIKSNLSVAGDYVTELADALPSGHQLADVVEDFQALLSESTAGAQRIATIVADLKTFSSIDQAEYSEFSVNEMIQAAIHLLQAGQTTPLPIHTQLAQLPPVFGHAARISQALYNILDNAAKAIDRDGKIHIETDLAGSDEVRIKIADSGCGVAEEVQGQVFDPFFTTRPVGSGTGLGLSVARDAVLAHKGLIHFHSEPGKGTLVSITLPRGRR